jgi:PIN domain
MSKAKKRSKPPELKVVFDTNAIFTDSAAFLLKREVSEIIRTNSSHRDLRIRWYLPEVVRWEREFQMRENGFALLPSIQKIEKVLKHNLNITEQTIRDRVPALVDEQLRELGIETVSFNAGSIDWPRIVMDAASRKPPFEKGEKEKGFRDAVILESFLQLVEDSPKTPSSCLIVLVGRDGPLTIAAKDRTSVAKNIRIVEDVTALKGLINTLVAKVDEEFVQSIKKESATYFFKDEKGSRAPSGLIFRENVMQQIQSKFTKELDFVPSGYDAKDKERVWVTDTRFSKKEGRRVYWVTRIEYEYKPYRWQEAGAYWPRYAGLEFQGPTGPTGPTGLESGSTILGNLGLTAYRAALESASGIEGPPHHELPHVNPYALKEKSFGKSGRIIFDVTWSVVISTERRKFSAAKIESIDYVETT